MAFEEKHGIYRDGYNKESEIPKGALKYDLSAFGMGIYDEKNKCYTGESYKQGYITGLEKLTDEERKKYLQLLDKANKDHKKWEEIEKKN